MSSEKMVLISSLGYIVPLSAIKQMAVVVKNEMAYEMPMREVSANPLVEKTRSIGYYLYLGIDAGAIPLFSDEDEDAPAEAEATPKRRGPKPKLAPTPKPDVKYFLLSLYDHVMSREETSLSKVPALHTFMQRGEESREKIMKNTGKLHELVNRMNASIEGMQPTMPSSVNDMLPPELRNDVSELTNSGIEVHAEQMRRQHDAAREKYDRYIGWFQKNILKGEVSDPEPLNVNTLPATVEVRGEDQYMTPKILTDAIRKEIQTVF